MVEILIYADEIQLFFTITCFHDQVLLQKYLEYISEWSALNRLMLNCDECKVISFNRSSKNLLPYKHTLNGAEFEKVEYMKDLGVIFDKNLLLKLM